MSGNLAYFVIREIIYSFLKRGHNLDENEIITYVLTELKSNKIIDSMDKTNLDFTVVYCIFDLLSSLGFLTVKLEKGQKLLFWKGFPGFYEKNLGVFNKPASAQPLPVPTAVPILPAAAATAPKSEDPAAAGSGDQQSIPNVYDAFARAFFDKMYAQPDNIVTFQEYQQVAGQFLYSGMRPRVSHGV